MVGRRNPVQPDSNSQRAILPGKILSSGPRRTGNVRGGEREDSCEGRSQMESFEDPAGRGTDAGALLLRVHSYKAGVVSALVGKGGEGCLLTSSLFY